MEINRISLIWNKPSGKETCPLLGKHLDAAQVPSGQMKVMVKGENAQNE